MCATVYMETAASIFHKCEYVDASMDNQLVAFPIYARMFANTNRRRNSNERKKDQQNQLLMQR